MIAKELQYRFKHYAVLVIGISAMFAVYVFSASVVLRTAVALLIGIVYILWGMWSHKGELKTMRLMLEYVAVGTLGAVILAVLAHTV